MADPRVKVKYAVPTKANTLFMDWWPLLNAELVRREWAECGFKDAKDCWLAGESPETAAVYLSELWLFLGQPERA